MRKRRRETIEMRKTRRWRENNKNEGEEGKTIEMRRRRENYKTEEKEEGKQ